MTDDSLNQQSGDKFSQSAATQNQTDQKDMIENPSRADVPEMFDRIAHRYDFLNHFLSANRDKVWRKQSATYLPDGDDLKVLDLATGTGDQLLALYATGRVTEGTGIDLSDGMLEIGRQKLTSLGLEKKLHLEKGNAESIPFADNSFNAVSISFGVRNVVELDRTLKEMHRVLTAGGRAIILEFSLPRNALFKSFYLFYFRFILPRLGRLISGDDSAYRYLNRTVETFPYGESFCKLMNVAGFVNVKQTLLTFGIASIYVGEKH